MLKNNIIRVMLRSTISLFIFFTISMSILAQKKPYSQTHKPITIRGTIMGHFEYRPTIPSQVSEIVFLQEKTETILPKYAIWLKLDNTSRRLLKEKFILIISINGADQNSELWDSEKKIISVNIYPVTAIKKTFFYTKDNSLLSPKIQQNTKILNRFWQTPSALDTIIKSPSENRDFRFTVSMIKNLDNNIPIIIKDIITHTDPIYTKVRLSEYSRNRLESLDEILSETDFSIPAKGATKKEWSLWYEQLLQSNLKIYESKQIKFVYTMGFPNTITINPPSDDNKSIDNMFNK